MAAADRISKTQPLNMESQGCIESLHHDDMMTCQLDIT